MSEYVDRFILNSDYATIKNDAKGSLSLSVTTGATIAAGSYLEFSNTTALGTINAGTRIHLETSADSGVWTPGNQKEIILSIRHNIVGNPTFNQFFVANTERISATTIKLYVRVPNTNPHSITIMSGAQTITAQIATFLSPFQ